MATEKEKENFQFQLLSKEIQHLKELLDEKDRGKDKALEMQAAFYEKDKLEQDKRIEKLTNKNNQLIGMGIFILFAIAVGTLIATSFKK